MQGAGDSLVARVPASLSLPGGQGVITCPQHTSQVRTPSSGTQEVGEASPGGIELCVSHHLFFLFYVTTLTVLLDGDPAPRVLMISLPVPVRGIK